ncbi:unnamed protein product [Cuscuta campestris]|uniref:Uncharacterized protein n=1 Tax=Cuscuta campestris TaxID=132261 RepID=A0A484LI98_9ASTE|nr:unnamed protein product [Cuscuta campestris]
MFKHSGEVPRNLGDVAGEGGRSLATIGVLLPELLPRSTAVGRMIKTSVDVGKRGRQTAGRPVEPPPPPLLLAFAGLPDQHFNDIVGGLA